ncbi:unnamed protein product [Protopolystoma xenopodis]|uniref:Uncharacterized protein n=1 Tax=Protopolystoma xenopodis TaxID=117903 RepID=A0A448XIG7_9PLAT|nr:unnamed protein product [Protopolystoma xenopodis]
MSSTGNSTELQFCKVSIVGTSALMHPVTHPKLEKDMSTLTEEEVGVIFLEVALNTQTMASDEHESGREAPPDLLRRFSFDRDCLHHLVVIRTRLSQPRRDSSGPFDLVLLDEVGSYLHWDCWCRNIHHLSGKLTRLYVTIRC